jgi:hypothetical protein
VSNDPLQLAFNTPFTRVRAIVSESEDLVLLAITRLTETHGVYAELSKYNARQLRDFLTRWLEES